MQHKRMRPVLIEMKNKNSPRPKFITGSYFARVLKIVNQQAMHTIRLCTPSGYAHHQAMHTIRLCTPSGYAHHQA